MHQQCLYYQQVDSHEPDNDLGGLVVPTSNLKCSTINNCSGIDQLLAQSTTDRDTVQSNLQMDNIATVFHIVVKIESRQKICHDQTFH